MGKGSDDPAPQPDPNIARAAAKQALLGNQWLTFAKDAFATAEGRQATIDTTAQTVADNALAAQTTSMENAATDRARYENTFVPLQDQIIQEAQNVDSQDAQAQAAAKAGADAQTAIAGERAASERALTSMGVNPNSGRFAGQRRAQDLGAALGTVGAKNDAREALRDKGFAMRMSAAGLGANLPSQSMAGTQLGLGAGQAAGSVLNAANQQFLSSTAIPMQGYSGAMQGYAGQASTLGNLYNSQLNAWSAQQQADAAESAGLFGAIGTGLGLATGFKSSKEYKTDKEPIPEGEALEAVESMPVERWRYMPGIADGGPHVGPYAEDMKEATGTGDGKTIQAQDAIGLTMKAVQDLNAKVDRIEGMIGLGKFPGRREMEAA